MTDISFVVPVFNEELRVVALLTELRAAVPDAQLIVVDGGSTDQTLMLARPHCDTCLVSPRGRASQMNAGAQLAEGEYLFFIHADCGMQNAAAAVIEMLRENPVWGFCAVQLDGTHPAFRVIETAMNWRSRLTRVATGDQMLFVERIVFDQLGGYANIPLMEDVELSKRLREITAPAICPQGVTTSARRWQQHGILRTVGLMWWLRLAYACGVAPEKLWRHYYGE